VAIGIVIISAMTAKLLQHHFLVSAKLLS